MTNEDKILEILVKMQGDLDTLKADVKALQRQEAMKDTPLDDDGVKRQLETLNKMRYLLTKEEADAVAAAVG